MEKEGEEPKKPIEIRAVEAIGSGFDLSYDFRLKYAKERLVIVNEANKRDIVVPGGDGVTIPQVSYDICCDKGDSGGRVSSGLLQFDRMSELFNLKSSVQGKVPSGYFNYIFNFSGASSNDAADTKYLAFDGYLVALYHLHLSSSTLLLHDKVKKSVPSHWDPVALSRFIQKYGTHIITGLALGGQNLVCVKQKASSTIPLTELKELVEEFGDSVFSDRSIPSQLETKVIDGRVQKVFYRDLQFHTTQPFSFKEISGSDGLSIIFSKRGGLGGSNWIQQVSANPDAIFFKFVPITSLLTGIPGSGYLSHAIDLYLQYKPNPEDLRFFLELQVPRQWEPMFNELPLGPHRMKASCPPLQFSFGGPKLYVSSTQVSSSQNPVVGMRLRVEGKKCNRLAIHLQRLSSLPNVIAFQSADSSTLKPCQWRGSDDFELFDHRFLEQVEWKGYSNVCTSPVKHDPIWVQGESDGVFIVTGAQLFSVGKLPKAVLHLRLLFTHLPKCRIRKTCWDSTRQPTLKLGFFSSLSTSFSTEMVTHPLVEIRSPASLDSGRLDAQPMPSHNAKLLKRLKHVETADLVRGPQDIPGHWLVTAARLIVEGGKIGLHVKFALLEYQEP